MTSAISKAKFILLFISVIFSAHTLANHSDEVVKNEFFAWHKRVHEARLSARTNGSPQSSNDTGFHSNDTGFQKPPYSLKDINNVDWGGAAQLNPPAGTFISTTAIWTIPRVEVPEGASRKGRWGASVWVGIDGIEGTPCPNRVIQAGTFSVVVTDENGDITLNTAYVWYNWYPSFPLFLETPFRYGDLIWVYIIANSPTHARAVFISPETTYTIYRDFQSPNSPATDICGRTAQWVVQPFPGTQLADFGNLYMAGCQARTNDDTNPTANLNGATLVTLEIDGNVRGTPSIMSSDELNILYADP